MIHNVCFKFEPGEHVRVTHLGLNYRGRVDECIYDGGRHKFRVEYADDAGAIQSREFYGDELASEAIDCFSGSNP